MQSLEIIAKYNEHSSFVTCKFVTKQLEEHGYILLLLQFWVAVLVHEVTDLLNRELLTDTLCKVTNKFISERTLQSNLSKQLSTQALNFVGLLLEAVLLLLLLDLWPLEASGHPRPVTAILVPVQANLVLEVIGIEVDVPSPDILVIMLVVALLPSLPRMVLE